MIKYLFLILVLPFVLSLEPCDSWSWNFDTFPINSDLSIIYSGFDEINQQNKIITNLNNPSNNALGYYYGDGNVASNSISRVDFTLDGNSGNEFGPEMINIGHSGSINNLVESTTISLSNAPQCFGGINQINTFPCSPDYLKYTGSRSNIYGDQTFINNVSSPDSIIIDWIFNITHTQSNFIFTYIVNELQGQNDINEYDEVFLFDDLTITAYCPIESGETSQSDTHNNLTEDLFSLLGISPLIGIFIILFIVSSILAYRNVNYEKTVDKEKSKKKKKKKTTTKKSEKRKKSSPKRTNSITKNQKKKQSQNDYLDIQSVAASEILTRLPGNYTSNDTKK